MVPQVGFDIVSSIVKVFEGWELGIGVYIRNTGHVKNDKKKQIFYFGPGSPKNRFFRFFLIISEKMGRKSGNHE